MADRIHELERRQAALAAKIKDLEQAHDDARVAWAKAAGGKGEPDATVALKESAEAVKAAQEEKPLLEQALLQARQDAIIAAAPEANKRLAAIEAAAAKEAAALRKSYPAALASARKLSRLASEHKDIVRSHGEICNRLAAHAPLDHEQFPVAMRGIQAVLLNEAARKHDPLL